MIVFLRQLLRSFPVQLLLLHLRTNFLLLAVWLVLLAMIAGWLGPSLGLQYLFLDPEYLGQTGFWPFVLVGLAFGFLVMSWNVSTYLLIGGYFGFLASQARPFFKYCINNALLPLAIFLAYGGVLFDFLGAGTRAPALSGLAMGVTASLFAYAIYFNVTNRDIGYYSSHRAPPPNRGPGDPLRAETDFRAYRRTAFRPAGLMDVHENPFRVRTYLTERLRLRLVRSVRHYDASLLRGIFRQNHLNALFLQFGNIVLLAGLGIFSDFTVFRIPAGASFIILFSLVISIISAISYWFAAWRGTIFVLLLLGLNFLTSTSYFQRGNQAYGLDYTTTAPYGNEEVNALLTPAVVARDRDSTLAILDRWKQRQPEARPPLVLVCASGGGLTAALWSTHLVQQIQRASGGTFFSRTALITGASGGMLGLANLREAYARDGLAPAGFANHLDAAASDLLNPLAFSIVSNDIFLPFSDVEIDGRSYPRDRAYAFERSFHESTDFRLDKTLNDYYEPERLAQIPLMLLTPSIVNDGRRMVISPQGVSYMMATPNAFSYDMRLEADMVDFGLLLSGQDAGRLRFSSALRANATYPYVLPLVRLPTVPTVKLLDAGYRDNYGIASASRFVQVFKDWILAETSGVVLVQISAFRRAPKGKTRNDHRGAVESLIDPVGIAGKFLSVQALEQENTLGELRTLLGADKFRLYRFNYLPGEDDPLRTSVSFHLTERERRQVLRAVDLPEHQAEISRLLEGLK